MRMVLSVSTAPAGESRAGVIPYVKYSGAVARVKPISPVEAAKCGRKRNRAG